MKASFTILHLLLFIFLSAQQSIFLDGADSWEAVLQRAKAANKPVFVDVYTEWCGPCKWMDENVFNDTDVISFFNKEFISVKIDAEKNFGVDFVRRNNVVSYPTFLFFSSSGQLVIIGDGLKDRDIMVAVAKDALANIREGVSLEDMKRKIEAGNKDPVFLKEYIKKLSLTKMPNANLIEFYLQILPEDSLKSDNALNLVSSGYFGRMPVQSRAFGVLLNAYKKYPVKSLELMSPWNTIRNRLLSYVDSAGILKDTVWLAEILQANGLLDESGFSRDREREYFLARFYASGKDSFRFLQTINRFIGDPIMHAERLRSLDTIQFNKALKLKFGITHMDSAKVIQEYASFKRTFLGDSRLTSNEVSEIIYLFRSNFPHLMRTNFPKVDEWLRYGILLYESNPIYVSPMLLKRLRDDYDRIMAELRVVGK